MALREINIKIDALRRWVDTLSAENIDHIEVGGEDYELIAMSKEMLKHQLSIFTDEVHRLKPSSNWLYALYNLSQFAMCAFFKTKNGAIRIANFYECLIKPVNSKTYKRIINGYDSLRQHRINKQKKIKPGNKAAKIQLTPPIPLPTAH